MTAIGLLRRIFLALVACAPALAAEAPAAERIAGPVAAEVVEVIDGDTVRVVAHVWPGHMVTVDVRLRGVDAPEMRSKCAEERASAERARAMLGARLAAGRVLLFDIAGGKYFGRVLADMRLAEGGDDLSAYMLAHGPVRAYDGRRRAPWCDGEGRYLRADAAGRLPSVYRPVEEAAAISVR